jgi:hypothetical protein
MSIKEIATDIFDVTAEPVVSIVSSIFIEGVIGSVVPGVVSAMMAYRYKRSEKMYEAFMREVKDNQEAYDERLSALEEERLQWFKDCVFPIVSDYVVSCNQEEKIKYLATGFLNIAGDPNIEENMILTYYDTLDSLSIADLLVLKRHSFFHKPDVDEEDILKDLLSLDMIRSGAVDNIKSKLRSMSLLESSADKQLEVLIKTVENIHEHLSNPKKKIKKSDIKTSFLNKYSLTKFGKRFLRFFCKIDTD